MTKPRHELPQMAELEIEGCASGPLWSSIKKQLYPSEVHHVKRLVGNELVKENRLMREELSSLQQILEQFRSQNGPLPEAIAGTPAVGTAAPSLHRELLRQQAQVLLQDAKSQAAASGSDLEALVPALGQKRLQDFVSAGAAVPGGSAALGIAGAGGGGPPSTPSTRPSTRPSSASGHSGCCGSLGEQQLASLPVLPLGRQLGVDELGPVAEGIREALLEEQSLLLAAIAEQQRLLEAEDARRLALTGATAAGAAAAAEAVDGGEPSTEEVQQLVHDLQDFVLARSSWAAPGGCDGPAPARAALLAGGSQVRRIRALIEQRRGCRAGGGGTMAALPEALEGVPEMAGLLGAPLGAGADGGVRQTLDPFFDDPFAL